MERKDFINVKRIVIKLGTNVLRNDEGEIAVSRIYSFIEDISKLAKAGKEVIVVTSGAVGLGKKKLNLANTDGDGVKQACAAVGQSQLMSYYEAGFATYGIPIAQILLTEDDFSMRHRYLSLRTTLNKLLELGVVPIINQNDTVSTIELNDMLAGLQVCFSDNDKLSALVSSELDADLLILLSDIDGLYTANPKEDSNAEFIREVECVTDEVLNLGTGASDGGRGGMKTKLESFMLVSGGPGMGWKSVLVVFGAVLLINGACDAGDQSPRESDMAETNNSSGTNGGDASQATINSSGCGESPCFQSAFHQALRGEMNLSGLTTIRLFVPLGKAGSRLRVTLRSGSVFLHHFSLNFSSSPLCSSSCSSRSKGNF